MQEVSTQNVLITLEEDISEIQDADLATILTQLELLMTQKMLRKQPSRV